MIGYVIAFVLGAVVGCAAALVWLKSIFRDPAKLANFAGMSGLSPDEVLRMLGLGKKEGEE